PAALLGALDEEPGDGRAGMLARDQHLVELVLDTGPRHTLRGPAHRFGSLMPPSNRRILRNFPGRVAGNVVQGLGDLGGELALLHAERALEVGRGAGTDDRGGD